MIGIHVTYKKGHLPDLAVLRDNGFRMSQHFPSFGIMAGYLPYPEHDREIKLQVEKIQSIPFVVEVELEEWGNEMVRRATTTKA